MWIQTEPSNQNSKNKRRRRKRKKKEKKMRWTLCKATLGTLQNEEMVILGRMGWMYMDTSRFTEMYYRWCQVNAPGRFCSFSLPAVSFNHLQWWGVAVKAHSVKLMWDGAHMWHIRRLWIHQRWPTMCCYASIWWEKMEAKVEWKEQWE